jgi:hypothetical protein
MSFRDRHWFLDGVYNSYQNPGAISAKELENISQRAGLSMEEVLSWFEDERVRRINLLASRQQQSQQSGHQFPPSPAKTTTPGPNSTATSSMTQFASTPGTFPQLQDIFSAPLVLPQQHLSVPVRRKRGRPAKRQSSTALDSPSPESKRQKTSTEYPCPDCGKSFAAERWSEHVKRVHFPDQVWECQKTNERTGKGCGSKPFFRPDNFGTHLKGEHGCSEPEISQLKATCKFRVMNFFHQICGLCDEFLVSRDESIEHIKCHFREISQRSNPPEDLGASEWKEKCGSDHKLKRGVHYHVNKNENGDILDRDRDRDDDGGPSQDDPDNQSHDNSHHQPDKSPNPDRDGGSTHPRTSQDSYPPFSGFAATPIYPDSQQYMNGKNSPPPCPVESPGLRLPPSSLSTDDSSFCSSQTSYTTSCIEHELAFTDVIKSHAFIGECPKVSESSPFVSTFVPSNPTGMMGSLLDRHGSDTSTLRSIQSPFCS